MAVELVVGRAESEFPSTAMPRDESSVAMLPLATTPSGLATASAVDTAARVSGSRVLD